MQTHLVTFQETFAPQVPNDSSLVKEIVDSLSLAVTIGSAYVFDFGT
jgi:hypothetical protein